jgi:hypothetical protein
VSSLLASAQAPPTPGPPKPRFSSGEGELKLETTGPSFWLRQRVELPDKRDVAGITVEVPALRASSGKAVTVKCVLEGQACDQPATLKPFESKLVEVSGEMPEPGDYSTWITLEYPGGSESRRLGVTYKLRSAATFNLSANELGTDGVLWLTLEDSVGVATQLDLPSLVLNRSQPNKPKLQASFTKLTVYDESGVAVSKPVQLGASESKRLKVVLAGLEPGHYEGKAVVRSLEGGRQEAPVSVSQRWPCCVAALMVLVGVLSSHWLRFWASNRRPLLEQRRNLSALRASFDVSAGDANGRNEQERLVVAGVAAALQRADEALLDGIPADFDRTLDRIRSKVDLLPTWISAQRRVQALEPAKLRVDFQDRLAAGKSYLIEAYPGSSDEKVVTDVKALDAAITSAVRQERLNQVQAARKSVAEAIADTSKPASFHALLQNTVEPKLKQAEDLITKDDGGAPSALNDARLEYARALLSDLTQTLDAARPAPFAADATTQPWEALRARVMAPMEAVATVAGSDAEPALEAYQLAYRTYLSGLADKTQEHARIQDAIAKAGIQPPKVDGIRARLKDLASALQAVKQKAAAGKFREAAQDFETAWRDYESLKDEIRSATGGPKLASGVPQPPAGAMNVGGSVSPAVRDNPDRMPDARAAALTAADQLRHLRASIKHGDWLFTLSVALISVLLGLKVLWIDDAGWGGLEDVLIALLWGLGLHQGSSGAFEGIAGLKTRLTSK